ncbi:nucleobase-ascorbate transporter 7-like [Vicia villosa]|uniref:nucleobase-ascorbate transporter 7-like n=1 Tax=Vicia villosa TaxID=3911 RepID=UPI00273B3B11|nr:nucleobase-ascorbate transporter 7-like [Vicia villosa]
MSQQVSSDSPISEQASYASAHEITPATPEARGGATQGLRILPPPLSEAFYTPPQQQNENVEAIDHDEEVDCDLTTPSWGMSLALGFQHYLVMLGKTVLIPTILVPLMGVRCKSLWFKLNIYKNEI